MYDAQAGVEDGPFQPFGDFKYKSKIVAEKHMNLLIAMGHDKGIFDFCFDIFGELPYCGRPQWLINFSHAICYFNFPSRLLLPHLRDVLEGLASMREALAESLLDTSVMREPALKIAQNFLDQLRCAVINTKPWEESSMKVRSEVLKVLEQCEALCVCTPRDSWHHRVKIVLRCLERCARPGMWNIMKPLLIAAESVIAYRCFSVAELKTLILIHDIALDYAANPETAATAHWGTACAEQCVKLWSQHNEFGVEPPQHVDETLHRATKASTTTVQDLPPQDNRADCCDSAEKEESNYRVPNTNE
eukprot:Blabericola_migrator_1__3267@NODE_1961_length_3492_cov_81_121752_g1191_i1_p2_GENE_NODE_1961_length_3492_cov_81_121752_g1191_i1NODE_1961_length_3492_cov_81_121752_g1191_i1_p2_ORF_typecomplete_len304_score45_31_NODE_1961_length_3492_cov_81_121752_g1191_i11912